MTRVPDRLPPQREMERIIKEEAVKLGIPQSEREKEVWRSGRLRKIGPLSKRQMDEMVRPDSPLNNEVRERWASMTRAVRGSVNGTLVEFLEICSPLMRTGDMQIGIRDTRESALRDHMSMNLGPKAEGDRLIYRLGLNPVTILGAESLEVLAMAARHETKHLEDFRDAEAQFFFLPPAEKAAALLGLYGRDPLGWEARAYSVEATAHLTHVVLTGRVIKQPSMIESLYMFVTSGQDGQNPAWIEYLRSSRRLPPSP